MINLIHFINSLKITWIRRMLQATDKPWLNLFESVITKVANLTELGHHYLKKLVAKLKNHFWIDTINAWLSLCNINRAHLEIDKLASPLWYNSTISREPLFFKDWYSKGIKFVTDIINSEQKIMSMDEIITVYNVEPINFLNFHRLKMVVRNFLNLPDQCEYNSCLKRPYVPFYLKIILKSAKGIKNIYSLLNDNYGKPVKIEKWNDELNLTIDEMTWKDIYKTCFTSIRDNYLIWFQYRVINRILGTRELLFKMKITDSSLCNLCNSTEETLVHLFCNCRIVKTLWDNLTSWIEHKINYTLTINKNTILLGFLIKNNHYKPVNAILTIAKAYIFRCSRQDRMPNILQLQINIKDHFFDQKTIAIINGKENEFNQTWRLWQTIFDNI